MSTDGLKSLVGRRVRIVTWEQGDSIVSFLERTRLSLTPQGTIRHICPSDNGDVWVLVDGLKRDYPFGMDQLEVLP